MRGTGRGCEPRYAIAVHIDRHGPGGEVAAGVAADVAGDLALGMAPP